MHVIDSFTGKYEFLSPAFNRTFYWDGWYYPTLEHAFFYALSGMRECHEAGTSCGELRQKMRRHGYRLTDLKSVDVINGLVIRRFRDVSIRRLLRLTASAKLVYGNSWGDTTLGVCDGVGDNLLGKALEFARRYYV